MGEVVVQARKGYVSLLTPRRTFAAVRPTTRTRVDLGLRLDGETARGRLVEAGGVGGGTINLRIGLTSVGDMDGGVLDALGRAYAENS